MFSFSVASKWITRHCFLRCNFPNVFMRYNSYYMPCLENDEPILFLLDIVLHYGVLACVHIIWLLDVCDRMPLVDISLVFAYNGLTLIQCFTPWKFNPLCYVFWLSWCIYYWIISLFKDYSPNYETECQPIDIKL